MTIRFGIVFLITLYITRCLLDILGVVDYGIYSVVCGVVSMMAFLNVSMSNGIQRFYNFHLGTDEEEQVTNVYNSALIIQGMLAVLVIVLAETVGLWYIRNHLVLPPERLMAAEWVFHGSVISFFFVILQVPYSAIIMAEEHMNYFAIVSVLDAVFKLIIVLTLPLFNYDALIVYALLFALISIIDFFLYFVYAKVNFKAIHLIPKSWRKLFVSMISFSGWNIFGSFAGVIKEQGIDVLMNMFFGPVINAARGVANQINSGLQSLIGNMNTAMRPQVIKSYAAQEFERTIRLTFASSKLSYILLYMVAVPLMLEIHFVLNVWLKGNVPDHTTGLLFIIILTWLVNNLNFAVSGVIHASGKMMLYQVTTSCISLMSLPISYLVLRQGGEPEYALIVVFVCTVISQSVSLVIMKRVINYSIRAYLCRIILPLLLMTIITLPLMYGLRSLMCEGWGRLIVVTISSIIVISLFSYLLVLDKNEKHVCRELINGKFIKK